MDPMLLTLIRIVQGVSGFIISITIGLDWLKVKKANWNLILSIALTLMILHIITGDIIMSYAWAIGSFLTFVVSSIND